MGMNGERKPEKLNRHPPMRLKTSAVFFSLWAYTSATGPYQSKLMTMSIHGEPSFHQLAGLNLEIGAASATGAPSAGGTWGTCPSPGTTAALLGFVPQPTSHKTRKIPRADKRTLPL